ncbi:Slh1p [Sugiyamaella lignohabitans]|uniref:Slh1p n=1 Tax=Sugiyamaella lignohabitans TaxID=796027 RepID=A0A161HGG1_9ASCO|nr:Slh1p [Sugiyamaella lignohabitans]ANB14830.1 Slh1p [Sugiyamaella lignohabitans]
MGTTRTQEEFYEEVIIPYPKKKTVIRDSDLVAIKDLDPLCQGTFSRYKTLNRMQSLVYPVGYNTNENMLVCAPTGAGKTDVALLTMLNTILHHSTYDEESGVYDIQYDDFKIVYVAPLKALAAEVVEKMGNRLAWLGVNVRELTGDMQLTRAEIAATQVIVTTPEKWDVVSRKSTGDNELVTKVKLLIIDEVHLLHEDRGAVIESLVARTLRQVESTQSMIRIVGLSATLPNFIDVAEFLRVNLQQGLFYFDASFRPVPLKQQFVGVKGKAGSKQAQENIDKVAYDKLIENLQQGHQVMVFVHSRKDTVKTSRTFMNMAQANGDMDLFDSSEVDGYDGFKREMSKHKNKDMKELFDRGFGVHHAGMLRAERNMTEKLFMNGAIKVLCCTATLAWGVNLPAAVVIVKGTQIYDAKQGGFVDLGISDVIQIFGRAGRPQFEKYGTGILCTSLDRLDHYLSAITQQHPIESRLQPKLADNLNAEISLGTVTNVDEGVQWLGYTYLFVRMRKNPLAYGLVWNDVVDDPLLGARRRALVVEAARRLHSIQMIIFDEGKTDSFLAKDLGRIASDFYLLNNSVEVFNTLLKPLATEADIFAMISMSGEFDGIKAREEESKELTKLREESSPCQIGSALDSPEGKTNVLLQAFISKATIQDSALSSDANYVAQNATRIARALFLICVNRRWGHLARVLLSLCKSVDRRLWSFEHPLAQFNELPMQIIRNLEAKNPSVLSLKEMETREIGELVRNTHQGNNVARLADRFPLLEVSNAEIQPITAKVLRVHVELEPDFKWDPKYHGKTQFFWVWIEEDSEKFEILHNEKVILSKGSMDSPHVLDFTIPISEPLPDQLIVRVMSDSWAGSETSVAVSFKHLIRPETQPIQTKLLKLRPLPVTALKNDLLESMYRQKFEYFNPMQTMAFNTLYHKDTSVLLGSPTGSGKTVACELAIWAAFKKFPGSKVVYIAPMKALVKERVGDWSRGICRQAGIKLVELTGDTNPDADSIRKADIIITTPEKFDGISRNWQTRKFVQQVSLIIMDEIHLLASDRGPILEMIVSRMNFIADKTKRKVRLLGMSTAVANAQDMASWLGVDDGSGLFNFSQSVRPVPLQMYIDGFPDNMGFCPLMKTMNKPAFLAIKRHSPTKPVLIFVASRRQTRITAQDLIQMCGMEENPRRFLKMTEDELATVLEEVTDETLKLSLQFGIALHHAGLIDSDRRISHELFATNKVQILVATSTLAWGVNLPAYLVIIKGTQFFDAKIDTYRDMDLTDVLQMMGRAGRPAFDTSGVAIVYTKESTKSFYKYFLNSGFPVESSLHKVLEDHLGAEISAGTISSKQQALDFLTWTFLYRRIHSNPTYYKIKGQESEEINDWAVELVNKTIANLADSGCAVEQEDCTVLATKFLRISSFYYMSHKTMKKFLENIKPSMSLRDCLLILAKATEYDELAIRHNEDLINEELSKKVRFHGEDVGLRMVDPHVKAYLLVQAHMSRIELPIEDYVQDTVAVLDQSLRILQAAVDTCAELGYLNSCLEFISLMRCIKQAYWDTTDPVTALPGLRLRDSAGDYDDRRPRLQDIAGNADEAAKQLHVAWKKQKEFKRVVSNLPILTINAHLEKSQVKVSLKHTHQVKAKKVYAPHFHKPQSESWFVILASGERELISLQRCSPGNSIANLTIEVPVQKSNLSLLIQNDALDISYTIPLGR